MINQKEISGQTSLYGLFALPAKHSLSPLMHNTSFQTVGIDARYLAFDILPENLQITIDSIRPLSIGGVNLSMPFKQMAIPYLDQITDRAQILESVNVIKNDDGKLVGDSVDGEGFVNSLKDNMVSLNGKEMTIFGAGGAGLSIVQASVSQGIRKINVFKRKNETFDIVGEKLNALSFKTTTQIELCDYSDVDLLSRKVSDSDIVVNATNVGMGRNIGKLPVPEEALSYLDDTKIVFDIIYVPDKTKLLEYAETKGCKTINGLGMLIQQGASSFKLWTGVNMPIEKVREKLSEQTKQKIESRN